MQGSIPGATTERMSCACSRGLQTWTLVGLLPPLPTAVGVTTPSTGQSRDANKQYIARPRVGFFCPALDHFPFLETWLVALALCFMKQNIRRKMAWPVDRGRHTLGAGASGGGPTSHLHPRHFLKNTEDVRDSANAQRATATTDSRAEVKLDPCAQLSEAGS